MVTCVWHRTFQHSVYPISPGLPHQTINYVTQVNSFFRAVCVVSVLSLCASALCLCANQSRVCIPVFFSFFQLAPAIMDVLRHQQTVAWPWWLEEPSHVLKWCDFVFFGRPLCNLVNAGTLHVGNVSEPCRELWLAHRAHSPTIQPLLLPQNLECSDARARSP